MAISKRIDVREKTLLYLNQNSIKEDSGCILWTGTLDKDGYGKGCVYFNRFRAHRRSYEVHNNVKVESSLFICHTCDNPRCINPEHLFVGTPLDNSRDKVSKGRQHIGEQLPWTKLTEQQVKEIRKLREQGSVYRTIAEKYGISITNVYDICRNHIWKHV